jgi:hypothetical protein
LVEKAVNPTTKKKWTQADVDALTMQDHPEPPGMTRREVFQQLVKDLQLDPEDVSRRYTKAEIMYYFFPAEPVSVALWKACYKRMTISQRLHLDRLKARHVID